MKLNEELNEIMKDRFSKDTVIALATISQRIPHVRNVNAYFGSMPSQRRARWDVHK